MSFVLGDTCSFKNLRRSQHSAVQDKTKRNIKENIKKETKLNNLTFSRNLFLPSLCPARSIDRWKPFRVPLYISESSMIAERSCA
jgi:hypothetical protein